MKWSTDMNKFIIHSYYMRAKLETDCAAWRHKVHQQFMEKFPGNNISEQRIADRKRAIENKNLLTRDIRDKIKMEVARMMMISSATEVSQADQDQHNDALTQGEEPQNETAMELVENSIPINMNTSADALAVMNEYKRAQIEYLQYPIEYRPDTKNKRNSNDQINYRDGEWISRGRFEN